MSAISVDLPDSLLQAVRELAQQDNISVDMFLALAAAEKLAVLRAYDYLEERAKRGSREKFEEVMAKIPHVQPEAHDRLE